MRHVMRGGGGEHSLKISVSYLLQYGIQFNAIEFNLIQCIGSKVTGIYAGWMLLNTVTARYGCVGRGGGCVCAYLPTDNLYGESALFEASLSRRQTMCFIFQSVMALYVVCLHKHHNLTFSLPFSTFLYICNAFE